MILWNLNGYSTKTESFLLNSHFTDHELAINHFICYVIHANFSSNYVLVVSEVNCDGLLVPVLTSVVFLILVVLKLSYDLLLF